MVKKKSNKKLTKGQIFNITVISVITALLIVFVVAAINGYSVYNEHQQFETFAEAIKTAVLSEVTGTPKVVDSLDLIVSDSGDQVYTVSLDEPITVTSSTNGITFSSTISKDEINNKLPSEFSTFKISHNTVCYSLVLCQIFNDYLKEMLNQNFIEDTQIEEILSSSQIKYLNFVPGFSLSNVKDQIYQEYYSSYIEALEINDDNAVYVKYFTIFDKANASSNYYTIDFSTAANTY